MPTQKAGCILINLESKKISLVFRREKDGYSFPKGHLEEGETLQQCAVRETEEETGRKNHLIDEQELAIVKYVTHLGEDVEVHFYLAIDDGLTDKTIPEDLQEISIWVSTDEVEEKLTFGNLRNFWNEVKGKVIDILK